jgi:hypothetical protein
MHFINFPAEMSAEIKPYSYPTQPQIYKAAPCYHKASPPSSREKAEQWTQAMPKTQ